MHIFHKWEPVDEEFGAEILKKTPYGVKWRATLRLKCMICGKTKTWRSILRHWEPIDPDPPGSTVQKIV